MLPAARWPHVGLDHSWPCRNRPVRLTEHAVDGGERAVIFDRFRGVLEDTVGEGTHFRIPWVQTPNIMDIRTRAKTISSVTGTKGE